MEQLQDLHHQVDINQPVAPKDPIYYLKLYKAISTGDWETTKRFFDADPRSLTAPITQKQEIPLHVAVRSRCSLEFIRRLVDSFPDDDDAALRLTTVDGATPLHIAAAVGNVEVAQLLVRKSPALLRLTNPKVNSFTPLVIAAGYGHKDATSYLLSVTPDDDDGGGPDNINPFRGSAGALLLSFLVYDDFYGLALDVLRKFPELARERWEEVRTALSTLASMPHAFPSGTRIGHCRRLWRRCKSSSLKVFKAFAPRIRGNDDAKNPPERKEHKQVMELLKSLISETMKGGTAREVEELLMPAIASAAELGIPEIVTEIIKAYPHAIFLISNQNLGIFQMAVIYRQEKVFNLMYQMGANKNLVAGFIGTDGDNLLHLAAKLGKTETIPGAALKVQRELQWFNEVEKVVQPTYRKSKNSKGKTPRELFTEEHKSLVEQGEKWMKETANSCSLVAALVVTVAFAAAFTLPGGTKDNGSPNYLNKPSLVVFMAADTLALFSASTSLLMFLGILTSRYSEGDFLRSLPIKMGVGLFTLFLSIAAMLIAFGASLHVVLYHNVNWIMAPIGLVASVPSLLFVFLQFPLLVELLFSTFGPSIFGKQSDEMII